MSFRDKVILITGSSAGIGEAAARAFASEGAAVIINGSSGRGEKTAEELRRAYNVPVQFFRGDISDVGTCRQLIGQTVRAYGRIDVLVNNAGIVPVGTILDFDEKDFDRAIDVNVKGAFFLSQFAVEQMLKQESRGSIVNIGSIAGMIGPKNRALYAASKGALISLTKAMAADLAATGIKVNCICPGMVDSPSLRQRIAASPDPRQTEISFNAAVPVGKIGSAADIAKAVLFAADHENTFLTGSVIIIDGGATL